jgi:hypothetical protein
MQTKSTVTYVMHWLSVVMSKDAVIIDEIIEAYVSQKKSK